jgi:single-strand DNA-binding protein
MNQLTIIGNLTRDPELRTTPNGINVCTFSVAVNRKIRRDNEPEADYFEVTAWRERGENCAKYLSKGRKVCVVGAVSVSTYTANDGTTRAKMKVTADEIEFLSPKDGAKEEMKVDHGSGYEDVSGSITDELPF